MLYTKKGDNGYTDLSDGSRIEKNANLIELIGAIDEFSASLGVSCIYASKDVKNEILQLQKQLVFVMAELAGGKKFVTADTVSEIEKQIDAHSPSFNGFVTVCDNPQYAYLNLSRCVIRRAERIAVGMKDSLSSDMLSYLNRLSDLIYAIS